MSIQIRIPESLQFKTNGEPIIHVMGNTIRECLIALVRRFPVLEGEIVDDQGVLLLKWLISINSKIVSTSDELSSPVAHGDVIGFIPVIAGG